MPGTRTRADRDPELPGLDGRVPPSALVISLLALGVAGAVAILWPESLSDLAALVWLLALIPSFLLAYHRGWQGAALGLTAAMALLIAIHIVPDLLGGTPVDWRITGVITGVLIAASLGAGAIADALRRRYGGTLEMAYADPLTGLPNRRVLDFFLARHFGGAARGAELSVVLFDLDQFKRTNDRFGHQAGDEVLRRFARVLQGNTRAMDVAGRFGGEEFLAILPATTAGAAQTFAERVRHALAAHVGAASDAAAPAGTVTVSAGVASYAPSMRASTDLLAAADRALYTAKSAGGNCVASAKFSAASESA